jgi:UDP-3-O-[3-hydroxymyristoyl] glucosamine N-acyltransferase
MAVSYALSAWLAQFGGVCDEASSVCITGVASLASAKQGDLSFCKSKAHLPLLEQSKASVVLVPEALKAACPGHAWVVEDPELIFARAARHFMPSKPKPFIHPTAVIHPSAQVHPSAFVGPFCVLEEAVVVGADAVIEAHTVLGHHVQVGEGCYLHARVTLNHGVVLHRRVEIHSGAVIGADGFGLSFDRDHWEKIPQLGTVILHDDVEVGACTTIDRAALDATVVHEGVKIDNHVQLGHNTQVGAHTVMAGCTAVGGSTKIGCYAVLGGSSILNDHITLADRVRLAGSTKVLASIAEPGDYASGVLVLMKAKAWLRMNAQIAQLGSWIKRIKTLEKKHHESEHT